LAFYRHPDDSGFAGQWSVDDSASKIGTVAAIHGKRRYDVLEVWGNVYKGSYRMRFIYALVGPDCVLMGEEILEDASL
jgi:pentose-5-phosphate-3-epimerase